MANIKQGNFEALPESGDDNFHTSIYEEGYDGLLIARCNQNGAYPHHVTAILNGLDGKRQSMDEITRLSAALAKAEAERDELAKALGEPVAYVNKVKNTLVSPKFFNCLIPEHKLRWTPLYALSHRKESP